MVRELTTKPFLRAAQGVAIFLTSVSEKNYRIRLYFCRLSIAVRLDLDAVH